MTDFFIGLTPNCDITSPHLEVLMSQVEIVGSGQTNGEPFLNVIYPAPKRSRAVGAAIALLEDLGYEVLRVTIDQSFFDESRPSMGTKPEVLDAL